MCVGGEKEERLTCAISWQQCTEVWTGKEGNIKQQFLKVMEKKEGTKANYLSGFTRLNRH